MQILSVERRLLTITLKYAIITAEKVFMRSRILDFLIASISHRNGLDHTFDHLRASEYVETVGKRIHESTDFGLKSTQKGQKRHKKLLSFDLGPGCRRFKSCHSDHMKIIRTFSYLEKRSDYLFYLSILILIAKNTKFL